MNTTVVLKKIESFLNGEINAEDFSYDFPVTYSFYAKKLDLENPAFSQLMENEVKPLCHSYDPFDYYNMNVDKIHDEVEFTKTVRILYEKAKTLL
jgi:hypothetical protein